MNRRSLLLSLSERAIAIALMSITYCSQAITAQVTDVESATRRLDKTLEKRQSYIDLRQSHIDSLVAEGVEKGFGPDIIEEIAGAYTAFNNDSALHYLSLGINTADNPERLKFQSKHASLLPLAGFFDDAQIEFYSIDPDDVPADMLATYYEDGRQMHSYIAAFFDEYPAVSDPHRKKALEFQEKLLAILPEGSPEYKYHLGEYNLFKGKKETARILLEEIVDTEPQTSNLHARAAHHLSTIWKEMGNNELYVYYLTLSATSDLVAATREVLALQELGNLVYESGDVARAHRYLSSALANAVECGAPLRMVSSAKSLPIIERAHSDQIANWRTTIYWILAVMAFLVLGLAATMLVLNMEMRKMGRLQANLKAANTAKEVYISQFLQLCSIYMDKLNQFCKIAARKLAAGQSDDLYRMTKSGKFAEEQSREFYEVFDNAFLHIYPDFVNQVNALLLPDQKIEVHPGELLNTDLRILAFMRLGIEESARIAQVLNYSLNTIYAYRNRLRAKAIDRDNFEKNIMKIDSSF